VPITLTPGDGQDLFARFKQAREQRDPDAMLELYAEEAAYDPDPFEPTLQGANAIREHWNDVVAEQVRVDIDAERIWVAGRTVLAIWHAAFTRMDTAVRVRVRGFSTMELDDEGSILRMRDWSLTREVGIDRGHRPSGPSNQAEE
jgi:ketosteroid isomerase-like protein